MCPCHVSCLISMHMFIHMCISTRPQFLEISHIASTEAWSHRGAGKAERSHAVYPQSISAGVTRRHFHKHSDVHIYPHPPARRLQNAPGQSRDQACRVRVSHEFRWQRARCVGERAAHCAGGFGGRRPAKPNASDSCPHAQRLNHCACTCVRVRVRAHSHVCACVYEFVRARAHALHAWLARVWVLVA